MNDINLLWQCFPGNVIDKCCVLVIGNIDVTPKYEYCFACKTYLQHRTWYECVYTTIPWIHGTINCKYCYVVCAYGYVMSAIYKVLSLQCIASNKL